MGIVPPTPSLPPRQIKYTTISLLEKQQWPTECGVVTLSPFEKVRRLFFIPGQICAERVTGNSVGFSEGLVTVVGGFLR